MMYHAQEKIVNMPGAETTGGRGGIHNSVTRATLKPTHMIGGYAQQSYGFNYYGTVGSNRDEFIIVRKMNKVDWLDEEISPAPLLQRGVDKNSLKFVDEPVPETFSDSDKVSSSVPPFEKGGLGGISAKQAKSGEKQ
jgi:hypothetical protein